MKHRRDRNVRPARTVALLIGAIVVVPGGAVGGAVALLEVQDWAGTSAPVGGVVRVPAVPQEPEKASGSDLAERRAEVMRTSRSYTRTRIRTVDSRLARAAQRDAAARERTIDELYQAAADRSEQIERRIARQRRLERQREARQRRIERRNRWVAPVDHYVITATFGETSSLWSSVHTGLDFAAPEGTPVMATAAGEVTSTTYDISYGNRIVITHDDGTQTWYCHLSSFYVSPGESVEAGETIGAVGSTGNATGPHLHLEVHPDGGAAVDPYPFLQARGAL